MWITMIKETQWLGAFECRRVKERETAFGCAECLVRKSMANEYGRVWEYYREVECNVKRD